LAPSCNNLSGYSWKIHYRSFHGKKFSDTHACGCCAYNTFLFSTSKQTTLIFIGSGNMKPLAARSEIFRVGVTFAFTKTKKHTVLPNKHICRFSLKTPVVYSPAFFSILPSNSMVGVTFVAVINIQQIFEIRHCMFDQ